MLVIICSLNIYVRPCSSPLVTRNGGGDSYYGGGGWCCSDCRDGGDW